MDELELSLEPTPERARFVEKIWDAHGGDDLRVGLELASGFEAIGETEHVQELLRRVAARVDHDDAEALTMIGKHMLNAGMAQEVLALIEASLGTHEAELQRLAAAAAVRLDSAEVAARILATSDGLEHALREEPGLRVKFLRLAGKGELLLARTSTELAELVSVLRREGLSRRTEAQIRNLYRLYAAMDRGDEIWQRFHDVLRGPDAARLAQLQQRVVTELEVRY
jgi:hypothetical protein